jgi:hypothetical protein
MDPNVWKSRESDLLAKYAERLRPADDVETEDGEPEGKEAVPSQRKTAANERLDEIVFSYMNGPPPKDLLNYKNMDLEMSLWAKTGTGWMSVGILFLLMVACFILTYIAWLIRGAIY